MPVVLRARPAAGRAGAAPLPRGLAGAGRGIVAGLGDVQLVARPELLALTPHRASVSYAEAIRRWPGGSPSRSGSFSRRLITSGVFSDVVRRVVLHRASSTARRPPDLTSTPGGAVVNGFQQRVAVLDDSDPPFPPPGLKGRRAQMSSLRSGEKSRLTQIRWARPSGMRSGQRLDHRPSGLATSSTGAARRPPPRPRASESVHYCPPAFEQAASSAWPAARTAPPTTQAQPRPPGRNPPAPCRRAR